MHKRLLEKFKESVQAVLPIVVIILLLNFTIAPMPGGTLALMLVGMLLLVLGLTLFSLGTDMAMMPMGEHVGSSLLSSRSLPLLVGVLFVFGFIVTAAEPDLSVLATQVPSIDDKVLIFAISAGVGIFLVIAALRVLFRWRLSHTLAVAYGLAFVLAIFSKDYLAVAFDASAVTTGPITVPFLLAIGSGFAAISSGKDSDEDNFGICGLCSVGPVFAVLILGMFYPATTSYQVEDTQAINSARELFATFGNGLLHKLLEVIMVIIPILGIFLIFQMVRLKLSRTELAKIFVGLAYLLVGLTIFLAGVDSGFMPAARYLGDAIASLSYKWILIPLCVIIGACVAMAEPAVHVLTRQVEEITSGAISRSMMLFGMALGVGLAMSLAMVRLIFDISVWWFIVPGFTLAIVLSFFTPNIFAGIGFDSGGVAAGAMSAAFVLPFTIGACDAMGGDIITGAFGVVGMIAMMPPVIVQLMGIIYNGKLKKARKLAEAAEANNAIETEGDVFLPPN